MANPPYELNPEVAWLMLELESEKGVVRALAFGRTNLPAYVDHECRGAPVVEGKVSRWRECAVRVRTTPGNVQAVDMFGELVELDGRYKMLSFANTL